MPKHRKRFVLAALLAGAFASPVAALQRSRDDLQGRLSDLTALIDAENGKSALCKSYVGKTVRVTGFDALSQSLNSAGGGKGEFETTAQYAARHAAASARLPSGPIIVSLQTDRDYVQYDADDHSMTVSAGAFAAGSFSSETQAEIAAGLVIINNKQASGIEVPYGQSERLIKSYTSQNGFGVPVRVSNVERQTKGFYVDAPHLFSFAKDDDTSVMLFDASPASAPRLKQTLRVALVVEPKNPFLLSGSMPGAAATSSDPVNYLERSSIIVVTAKCGLILDAQSRVLASADAGSSE